MDLNYIHLNYVSFPFGPAGCWGSRAYREGRRGRGGREEEEGRKERGRKQGRKSEVELGEKGKERGKGAGEEE